MSPLERLLNRVGKRVFIDHYSDFQSCTLSAGEVVALLPQEFTLKSRWSRTSKARRIFREGLAEHALRLTFAQDMPFPDGDDGSLVHGAIGVAAWGFRVVDRPGNLGAQYVVYSQGEGFSWRESS